MPPDKIRIPLDEHRFENVGRLADGRQFMAFVTGAMPKGMKYPSPDQYHLKRWLAVSHLFDSEGNHLVKRITVGWIRLRRSRYCG